MQQEDQIFRLNKRIKELIAIYEKTLSQNVQLDSDNERLSTSFTASDEHLKRALNLNVQYKHELDKLNMDRDQQQKVQHQLKTKLNETMSICREQNNEIATLKRSLQNQRAISMAPQAASAPATIVKDTADAEECKKLRIELKQLEDELQESYELIDDLEFEVEQIGYLETENERLQEEISILQAAVARYSAASSTTSTSSSATSANLEAMYATVAPHHRQPMAGNVPTSRMLSTNSRQHTDGNDDDDDDFDEEDECGVDEVDDKPVPQQQQQQRREVLHRKLETLQQRQSRRSEDLAEKFQRGLSIRRQ